MLAVGVKSVAFFAVIPIILSVPSQPGRGDEPRPTLAIRLARPDVVLYEPLLVTARLTNSFDRTITVEEDLASQVCYECRSSNTSFMRCAYGRFYRDWRDPLPMTLGPGKSRAWGEALLWRDPRHYEGQPFVFSRPGKYEIRAITEDLESNSLDVVVKEASAADAPAVAIVSDPAVAQFLQQGYLKKGEDVAVARVKELVEKFPKSAYADYANYRLARYLHESYRDPTLHRTAFEHYAAVSRRIPALRVRAAYHQIDMVYAAFPSLRPKADFYSLKKDLSGPAARDTLAEDGVSWESLQSNLRILEIHYMKDDRLDRKVDYRFTDANTIGDLLQAMSAQTGVGLDTDSVTKAQRLAGPGAISGTLRGYMLKHSTSDRYWQRRGEGYFLVDEEPSEPHGVPEGQRRRFL